MFQGRISSNHPPPSSNTRTRRSQRSARAPAVPAVPRLQEALGLIDGDAPPWRATASRDLVRRTSGKILCAFEQATEVMNTPRSDSPSGV